MITQDRLRELLSYDPETGVFRWRVPVRGFEVGDTISRVDSEGYIVVSLPPGSSSVPFNGHRLAWMYTHGYFPEHDIDHINGVRTDNRIKNLRQVSRSCNMQNCKVYKTNTSGFPGVCWDKRRGVFISNITIDRKTIHIGYFKDPLEAALSRFNFEVVDPRWTCNHRSNLAKAIKAAWPEFKGHHV